MRSIIKFCCRYIVKKYPHALGYPFVPVIDQLLPDIQLHVRDAKAAQRSGFRAAASKSPEMGVSAMAISFIIVPIVSQLTKNSTEDRARAEAPLSCKDEDENAKCVTKTKTNGCFFIKPIDYISIS